ncbi:T9SS type A sorting domain-containing protein [Flavobacterium sp. HXWNR69]|uniref:T9SS type A sorting domain-containing protein n=1 Tax=Flavobacterium fragile TaxID=2949085 RepID=A0ABT0TCU6_9FLAO|nr:T9SS type A sorting domain-containing protein [Flavobacterium sp. HXWNR69]MCL9768806.1 T9SS type A sorting domain-containing protein [Flavobacterium sp. HXWNR69]
MKKLYTLLLIAVSTLSFGQLLSDDFNYTDNALLTANGWTAHSGSGSQAIDVGASNGLTYTGYSGLTGFTAAAIGNAARLDNNGEDVNKAFAAPVTSGDLYVSFLVNVTTAVDGYYLSLGTGTSTFFSRLYTRPSATSGKINFGIGNSAATYSTTDFDLNTTYLVVIKYGVSTASPVSLWVFPSGIPATEALAGTPLVTASGSGGASVAGVYLRQFATSGSSPNVTIDGLRVYSTWFNTTACSLSLASATTLCDAITSSVDTYTATIPFTGGNTGTYTLSTTSGTISGDNPSTTASGNIIITGINENTNVTLTVTGACSLSSLITAPECKVTNTLPFNEPFNYTVGTALSTSQFWTNTSVGADEILAVSGSLNYTGITSTGNSVSFIGAGSDTRTPFTSTTSGDLFTSFLVSVTDLTGISTTGQSYFATLSNATNTFSGRIWIRTTNGTQYQFGINNSNTTTDIVWSSNLYNINTTQYLVLRYDFTNNLLALYENPTIGGNATPTMTFSPTATFDSIANFVLRQDAAGATPAMIVDELTISTTPNFTLSSSSFDAIEGLTMYPNPLKGDTLFLTSTANAVMSVQIFDVLGKEVLKSNVMNNTVNVSGLNAGVYMVKVTEEGKTATRKLVIQ